MDFREKLSEKMKDPEFRAAYEALEPIEPRRNWHAFYRHTIRSLNFKPREWIYYWRKFILCECVEKLQ
jgi:hypothetical protein